MLSWRNENFGRFADVGSPDSFATLSELFETPDVAFRCPHGPINFSSPPLCL